jgi:hypothetical protein
MVITESLNDDGHKIASFTIDNDVNYSVLRIFTIDSDGRAVTVWMKLSEVKKLQELIIKGACSCDELAR